MRLTFEHNAERTKSVKGIKRDCKAGDVLVNVRLTEEALEMVKALAVQSRRNVSGQIRHMIETGLTR